MPPVRIDVVKGHDGCPSGKPWAVVGADTGKVHGCHPTKAQARRQQSAIYAAVSRRGGARMSTVTEEQVVADEIAEEEVAYEVTTERKRLPWEGILAIAGWPTSDKRYLIPGEIGHRPLPLPLAASHEDQHATETVGRIDSIQVIPASRFKKQGWDLPADLPDHAEVIWGQGSFDGSPEADDALRQIENGVGVSLDLPTERKALIDAKTYEEVEPDVALKGADPLDVLFGGVPDGYLRGFAGKIGGLSLASIAAFEETAIRPVGESALVATAGTEIRIVRETLTASAAGLAPLKPPKDWFYRPEAQEPCPLTVTETGEVYGHLALFGQCHAASARCELAPKSPSGYAFFHTGQLETAEGEFINVGRITVGDPGNAKGGHADLVLGTRGAMEHYDTTGCVGAFVRATDGRHGIWLSGAVRSDAPAERVRDMQANPPSGDWRPEARGLELVAALSVPVGGFPIPRYEARLVATGGVEEVEALIMQGYIEEEEMEVSKAEIRRKTVLEQARAELEWERDGFAYTAEQRRRMARNGQALPDGSFPIANCGDAENAIHAQGRAGNQGRAVAHIKKRVRALGCSGGIFDPYK